MSDDDLGAFPAKSPDDPAPPAPALDAMLTAAEDGWRAVAAQSAPNTDAELGHLFTIAEAAEACGLSRDAIKRRTVGYKSKSGAVQPPKFPHARLVSGVWKIPLADLLAEGLHPNPLGQVETSPEAVAPPDTYAQRVAELEAENRRLRDVLDERDRALRIAERALAALPAPADTQADAPPPEATPQPPRRGWFRRKT